MQLPFQKQSLSPFGADRTLYQALAGVDLSRLIYPLSGESSVVIAGALETIAEHHPGESIWVESNVRT